MSKVIQFDKICTVYREKVVSFDATGNDAVENDDGYDSFW
jgi:hypothetical protein